MKFTPLPVAGAFLIEPLPQEDARGSFARIFCREAPEDLEDEEGGEAGW